MKYKFMQYQELNKRFEKLLEKWNACCTLLYKMIKSDFSAETVEITKSIQSRLNRRDLKGVAENIGELGAWLDKIHDHTQDLNVICTEMWDLVKDHT